MYTRFAVTVGKSISLLSKALKFGAGATWPGEIALTLYPTILAKLTRHIRKGVILVVGTNGKTTTSLMLKTILERNGDRVVHNASGANLLNGLVSACVDASDAFGMLHADWAVFEVDENSLPIVLRYSTPTAIVFLNLFRDQLDRYGEVDVIAEKWEKAIARLSSETTLILNADDPLIAFLGKRPKGQVQYFGIDDTKDASDTQEHATDSIFCLSCGARLSYRRIYLSHLGDWHCTKCKEKRPKLNLSEWTSPLLGLYNKYNTLAAALTARTLGVEKTTIENTISAFRPAFGRQEEFTVDGKVVKLFLSKNPAGFNASLRTVLELKPKAMLLVLNDRIPDGRDVSWIWDVDFENIKHGISVIVSGDRVYDMAVRMKYAQGQRLTTEENLEKSIASGLELLKQSETLYVLCTYSAMLEVRRILSGKKIL